MRITFSLTSIALFSWLIFISIRGGVKASSITVDTNAWVNAHNARRQSYHTDNSITPYVPVSWDSTLANDAQTYANLLVSQSNETQMCTLLPSVDNDASSSSSVTGENLYLFRRIVSPDDVLSYWFDEQISLSYPHNIEATQVVWRSTAHVGCGEAHISGCYIAVCKYVSIGNCNIEPSNTLLGENGHGLELQETSPCCPKTLNDTSLDESNNTCTIVPAPTPQPSMYPSSYPSTSPSALPTGYPSVSPPGNNNNTKSPLIGEAKLTLHGGSTSPIRRNLNQSQRYRGLQPSCSNEVYNDTIAELIKDQIEIVLTDELDTHVSVANYTQSLNEDCLIEFVVKFTVDSNNGNAPTVMSVLAIFATDDVTNNLVTAIQTIGGDIVETLNVAVVDVGPVLSEITDKFSYDVSYDNIAAVFSDAMSAEEVKIQYNMSLRGRSVTLYDYDTCSSVVGTDIIGLMYGLEQTSSTHGDLNVVLNIRQEAIVGSDVWDNGSDPLGRTKSIELCVRVDLYEKDTTMSVTFHELKVNITIDMTKDFTIEAISTNRDEADTLDETASLNYDVNAYQCNAAGIAEQLTLSQGDVCGVCVEVNSTTNDVYVATILELNFTQNDALVFRAIIDGATTGLTSLDCESVIPGTCVTRSQLISGFFDEDTPESIRVDGICVLAFGNARRLFNVDRSLQGTAENEDASSSSSSSTRSGSNSYSEKSFNILVGLQGNDSERIDQPSRNFNDETSPGVSFSLFTMNSEYLLVVAVAVFVPLWLV